MSEDKRTKVTSLVMRIAFASLRSNCDCEVCNLGRELAQLLEDQISARPSKRARVVE